MSPEKVRANVGREPAPNDSAIEETDSEQTGFEQSVAELEAAVDRLEHEELDLEEALAVFERGVALSRQCAAKLEAAETRIEVLVREGGSWLERPFEAREADDAEGSNDAGEDDFAGDRE